MHVEAVVVKDRTQPQCVRFENLTDGIWCLEHESDVDPTVDCFVIVKSLGIRLHLHKPGGTLRIRSLDHTDEEWRDFTFVKVEGYHIVFTIHPGA